MKSQIATLALLLSSLGSSLAHAATSYENALYCGDGEAVVDVDTQERRNLQLVIRDAGAIETLRSAGYGELFADRVNAKGELVLEARVDRGVFSRGDFTALRYRRSHEGLATSSSVDAFREGSRLVVRVYDSTTRRTCRGIDATGWDECSDGFETVGPHEVVRVSFEGCR